MKTPLSQSSKAQVPASSISAPHLEHWPLGHHPCRHHPAPLRALARLPRVGSHIAVDRRQRESMHSCVEELWPVTTPRRTQSALCTLSSRPVLHLEPFLSGCRGAPLLLLLPLPPPRPPPLQRPQGPFGNERFDGAFLKCMCVCAYVRKKRTISINDLAEVTADNMIIHMDSATAELSPSSPPSESESPAAAGRHRSHTCDFLTYSVFPKRASSSPSSRRCNSVRSRSSAPAGAPAAAPRVRPTSRC